MSFDRRSRWFLALVVGCCAGCGSVVQIGVEEDAFSEVDALYTAVTTRRADLLQQSKARLVALKDDGKLPDAALSALRPVIAQAEQGEWRPAAERLYAFMRQQRKGR